MCLVFTLFATLTSWSGSDKTCLLLLQVPMLLANRCTGVGWSTYHLHRLAPLYGPDSRVYRPQRWESGELIKTVGLGAGFIDFNGGLRVCLGSMPFKLHAAFYSHANCLQKILLSWRQATQ